MHRLAQGLDPRGSVAEAIAELWWVLLGLGAAVFVVFATVLVWSLFRSRDGAQQVDRRRLVVRWIGGGGVLLPLVLLVVVFGATVVAMRSVPYQATRADALVVEVVGHRWWYEVRYPDQGVATRNELHLPAGRQVVLELSSADVIHSFWVPELAGKIDMLPDRTNELVLETGAPGRFQARCAEFCGLHHATMVMPVVVEPEAAFEAWTRERR